MTKEWQQSSRQTAGSTEYALPMHALPMHGLRLRMLLALALGAIATRAHNYPPGGDCVRAHPERALTLQEVASEQPSDVVCRTTPG